MATVTKKARAPKRIERGAVLASDWVSMEFLILEDNSGHFYWTLSDGEGKNLARSPGFTSYEEAEEAARGVLAGAGSVTVSPRRASTSAA
jgi:uncharacterized protein YegP (UPF0339 family)